MIAIMEALDWASKRLKTEATIFSDSLSSLKAIENISNSHPLVVSIHNLLDTIRFRHRINFVWVKAHVGIIGNEVADTLAKDAATQHTSSAYNNFPISLAKRIIRQKAVNEWATEYANATQGSMTRKWFPTLNDAESFRSLMTPSFEMTQILTGHGFNKTNLKRFHITTDDKCPCDATTEQTIEHLIKECPKYSAARFAYTASLSSDTNPFDLKTPDIDAIGRFKEFVEGVIKTLKDFNST